MILFKSSLALCSFYVAFKRHVGLLFQNNSIQLGEDGANNNGYIIRGICFIPTFKDKNNEALSFLNPLLSVRACVCEG
jgi:hypothetical protein